MTLDLPHEHFAHDSAEVIPIVSRRDAATVNLALVGGFAPRKCGIATFTTDIFEQLAAHQPRIRADVFAIEEPGGTRADDRVAGRIVSNDPAAWREAARIINDGGYEAVWLQHEYGIFGGECGEMVLEFAERIVAPLIVTFHTVLTEPSPKQREILDRLIAQASQIMVMSRRSRDLLVSHYGASGDRIRVIEHGAPDRPFGRQAEFKQRLGLGQRPVLMTFGLLGPGKGIETMISALPAITERHPDVLYRIVGATHPNLVAAEGEAYREKLEALTERLGVSDNVVFDNRFLDTAELLDQLEACDIYITPYPNLQQSTSGTLSYAVALGKAVVSTPYVHAGELLGDGVGVLVEPGSAPALAEAVLGLLDDPARLAATQRKAWERGRQTIWPHFAAAAASLVERAARRPVTALAPLRFIPALTAVETMSDGTGMYQHAIGIVPDRRHGYCLDDNVRALLLMVRATHLPRDVRERYISTYASFIQHAWNEDRGAFRNFMSFDRTWCEEVGSQDSNGRTAWALGELIASDLAPDWKQWGKRWFDVSIRSMGEIESPRAVAFAMLGAASALRAGIVHDEARNLLERGGALLASLLDSSRRPDWAWFEAVLGYDNPRLPQALLEAGMVLDQPAWRESALETLDWIAARQRSTPGHFRPVGSESFGRDYTSLPFDQQPLEAWAAIDAASSAYHATRELRWLAHAESAYRWFFGANDRGIALGDLATGRCRDGVNPQGVNENCGAESILAFQLSCHAMAGLARVAGRGDTGDRLGRSTQHPGHASAPSPARAPGNAPAYS